MPRDEQSLQLGYGAEGKKPGAGIRMEAAPAAGTFEAVYDRYLQPVYRYILSRVRNVPEAEDLTSLTFLTALESFPRFHEQGRTTAWLFTIARNKIVDSSRRRSASPLPDDENSPLFADDPNRGWGIELLLAVRMRISALPDEEQELLRLRYNADLSFAEIAAVLGKREAAVKKSLYRLVTRLRNDLEDHHE